MSTTTVTPEKVETIVVDAIATLGPDRAEITRDATFSDLDVDSLDFAELTQVFHDELGVELKSGDAKAVKTVGDVIDLVLSRV